MKKKTARTEKQFEFGSVREFFAAGMHAISLPRDTSAEHRYNYSTKFFFLGLSSLNLESQLKR